MFLRILGFRPSGASAARLRLALAVGEKPLSGVVRKGVAWAFKVVVLLTVEDHFYCTLTCYRNGPIAPDTAPSVFSLPWGP